MIKFTHLLSILLFGLLPTSYCLLPPAAVAAPKVRSAGVAGDSIPPTLKNSPE